ncbi:MAG: PQQ-binding-like beta-propeller repeat protein [Pyrinomonadaceae bacterium]
MFKVAVYLFALLGLTLTAVSAQSNAAWQARLDSEIRFYQPTDFGIVLAATERSLYAIDSQTGAQIWRLGTGRIGETGITPVPGTDLILLSRDLGDKSRVEALDVLTGERIWQSEKIKGDVLQLAAEPSNDLLAVVLVRKVRGDAGREFKGTPIVHVLRISTGDELWKRELDSDVAMMPARFGEGVGDISYTLDNYRAPLLLDGRLFLFYDGVTSFDARTGREKEREKFRINESGLALTEADPVYDDRSVYISGRGRIRAVDRRTGSVVWKADDLGTVAEMVLIGDRLFARTGGQFTRLKDGETESKGPFGVSAIDVKTGDTVWRYKGADKGITNLAFADEGRTVILADRDDLITLDARSGERRARLEHGVESARFVLVNESGEAVVGGRDEIAAFARGGGTERWRVRHKAPGRGALRVIGGIALRAAALYFRYAGPVTSAVGLARGGLNLASAANSFRWSGLAARFSSVDLTSLAAGSARSYVSGRIYSYGALSRLGPNVARLSGLQIERPGAASIGGRAARSAASEARESVLDRLDPTRYAERLSDYLLRRKRLAELRGSHMYFYTELPKPFGQKGLVGVNVHTGRDARFVLASDPDPRFLTDETGEMLITADGSRLQGYELLRR